MLLRCMLLAGSFGLTAAWAQAPPPVSLNVVSATSQQVQLSWSAASGATSYVVQRQPVVITSDGIPGDSLNVSAGSFSNVLTVTSVTATDQSIDPYTTYAYCVVSVNNFGNSSCSNSVTVGPPPFGFNVVIPSTADTAYTVGVLERMELDGSGEPAMSYLMIDPNNLGDESDDTLYFVSWNRAQYTWNPPVAVAVTGPGFDEGPTMPISLARDAATGMWGLAYNRTTLDGNSTIMLSTSLDGGVTWQSQSISGAPYAGSLCAPSLALWNGSFYATFLTDAWFDGSGTLFPQNGTGFFYVTGKVTDDPSKWTSLPVPFPGDYISAYDTVSLALDSAHHPGMAFNSANDTYEGVVFWRPEMGATLVAHNDGYTTNDNPAISLTFFGTQPRIVTDAKWNYGSFDPDHEPAAVWAMAAADGYGATWLPPVDVPADFVNELELPWITSGSQGQAAIAIASNQDPEGSGMICGFPKIARSSDFLSFQTCAPAPADNPSFAPNNMHPVLRFGGNDKLWLSFNNNDSTGSLGLGLILWREQ